ncbi:hypothetical protein [Cytobacillus firmus]|uniref:hypothetical protein n=1 Tax=Cytobacillus firmus TaxID=1399 RepID=UPI0021621D02|nr:hypothetical protein [Cytobacillus firmus]MCS0673628.1 hypothetical protein [Cytobacillus firmus]
MKTKLLLTIFMAFSVSQSYAYAQSPSYPCSIVLEPVNEIPNISGTALMTKVKKPYTDQPGSPVRERTGVGIYADWMPQPFVWGRQF